MGSPLAGLSLALAVPVMPMAQQMQMTVLLVPVGPMVTQMMTQMPGVVQIPMHM